MYLEDLFEHTFTRGSNIVAVIYNHLPEVAGQKLAAMSVVNKWDTVSTCYASEAAKEREYRRWGIGPATARP